MILHAMNVAARLREACFAHAFGDQFLGRLLLALGIDDLGAASRDRKARLIRLGESGWRRTVPKVPGRFVDDLRQNSDDHHEPIIVRSGLLLGKAYRVGCYWIGGSLSLRLHMRRR
jgi:hypothetical protein